MPNLKLFVKEPFHIFLFIWNTRFIQAKKKAFTVTPVNTMSDFADISLFYYTVILKDEF